MRRVMIRGIRPLTDVAAEFTMLLANRQLADDVETIFLMADEELAHVSSSLIKQITPVTTDEMLARFVPAEIIPDIRSKIPGPREESEGMMTVSGMVHRSEHRCVRTDLRDVVTLDLTLISSSPGHRRRRACAGAAAGNWPVRCCGRPCRVRCRAASADGRAGCE